MQNEQATLFNEFAKILLHVPLLLLASYLVAVATNVSPVAAFGFIRSAKCNVNELKQQELLIFILWILNQAQPVAQRFNLANFSEFLLVQLAECHEDPPLLIWIDTCHETFLKLVPEAVGILYQVAVFESWCLCFDLKQSRQIVPTNEVVLSEAIVVHFKLSVVPLDRLEYVAGEDHTCLVARSCNICMLIHTAITCLMR